ncbi:uncharacterized protein DC041_0005037 [Schistosoma bovis]|uniref:Uncharacterized protein n=1 Tax=Schistosoma bovis TaxID=6184 RepID=A0A430QJW0_SCHBO|nr:uncharacterized protein DC041_0005037 [Schistosoma bovis]
MDDIKSALEVELERLRKLVRKYRTESIVFAKPRKSKSLEYSAELRSNENSDAYESHNAVSSFNCEQLSSPNVPKSRCVQFAAVNNCCANRLSDSDEVIRKPNRPSQHRTRFLDPPTNIDMPSRYHPVPKYPPEEYVNILVFKLVTEYVQIPYDPCHLHKIIYLYPHRTLRGVYEHTGGRNLALMAALENTLEEALKVEKDRRLTILDGINKPNKPDYFSPQYERDYRWQAAIRAYEIEQANREFRLIQSELERLKALQAERRNQQE